MSLNMKKIHNWKEQLTWTLQASGYTVITMQYGELHYLAIWFNICVSAIQELCKKNKPVFIFILKMPQHYSRAASLTTGHITHVECVIWNVMKCCWEIMNVRVAFLFLTNKLWLSKGFRMLKVH